MTALLIQRIIRKAQTDFPGGGAADEGTAGEGTAGEKITGRKAINQ